MQVINVSFHGKNFFLCFIYDNTPFKADKVLLNLALNNYLPNTLVKVRHSSNMLAFLQGGKKRLIVFHPLSCDRLIKIPD